MTVEIASCSQNRTSILHACGSKVAEPDGPGRGGNGGSGAGGKFSIQAVALNRVEADGARQRAQASQAVVATSEACPSEHSPY